VVGQDPAGAPSFHTAIALSLPVRPQVVTVATPFIVAVQ
jgi:hypothetical protein